jgi:hypothetical protein
MPAECIVAIVVSTVCSVWLLFWLGWVLYTKRESVSRLCIDFLVLLFWYLTHYLPLKYLFYSRVQSWYRSFTFSACTGSKSRRRPSVGVPVPVNPPLALPAPPPSPDQGPKQLGLSQLLHWPRLVKVWTENEVLECTKLIIYFTWFHGGSIFREG